MALQITQTDNLVQYKNSALAQSGLYVVINPNFNMVQNHTKVVGETTIEGKIIKCEIYDFKDKESVPNADGSINRNNVLNASYINPVEWLFYTDKQTLELEINEDLKAKLIEGNPTWENNINIVDLGYQINP